jgi:hypothetical protein
MDLYNLQDEYGPVWGTDKFRFLTTTVYELPCGRGRQYMASARGVVDAFFGGWRLSNIFLLQTGPFETPYFSKGDLSCTGSAVRDGRPQHPDRVGNGSLSNPTASQWYNTAAFVSPQLRIGLPVQVAPLVTTPRKTSLPSGASGTPGSACSRGLEP